MISKNSYTKNNIDNLTYKHKTDPQILERTIFAFGLLEALVLSKMDFVFKGGTALMLLLNHPLRLSTDIDIIVNQDYEIEKYLEVASKIYPFIKYEEITRVGTNGIIKKHYRFFYKSLINQDILIPIILDVVFEKNRYAVLVKKEIKNDFLQIVNPKIYVTTPDINSILGEKLTAFAPHTIGIMPINIRHDGKIIDKRIEVIKQFFDIGSLFDLINDFETVLKTYKQASLCELQYRGLNITYKDCLLDTFNAAMSILSKGKFNQNDYCDYLYGIRGLSGHLINIRFNAEIAYKQAAKVMYITACIISETIPEKEIPDSMYFTNEYSFINKIRKVDKYSFNLAARAVNLVMSSKNQNYKK